MHIKMITNWNGKNKVNIAGLSKIKSHSWRNKTKTRMSKKTQYSLLRKFYYKTQKNLTLRYEYNDKKAMAIFKFFFFFFFLSTDNKINWHSWNLIIYFMIFFVVIFYFSFFLSLCMLEITYICDANKIHCDANGLVAAKVHDFSTLYSTSKSSLKSNSQVRHAVQHVSHSRSESAQLQHYQQQQMDGIGSDSAELIGKCVCVCACKIYVCVNK